MNAYWLGFPGKDLTHPFMVECIRVRGAWVALDPAGHPARHVSYRIHPIPPVRLFETRAEAAAHGEPVCVDVLWGVPVRVHMVDRVASGAPAVDSSDTTTMEPAAPGRGARNAESVRGAA